MKYSAGYFTYLTIKKPLDAILKGQCHCSFVQSIKLKH